MSMNPLYDVPVEATVNGIKIHYDGGEVEVTYDVSDGDVVRLTIEPLEVKVTDGFRAAVKKACKCGSSSGGSTGGGSTGGGGAVAHATYEIDETTQMPASIVLDMTVDEIVAAEGNVSVVANLGVPEHTFIVVGRVAEIGDDGIKVIGIPGASLDDNYYTTLTVFADTDAHGYPVWYASGGGGPK